LDGGSGSCLLGDPENARIVADALHHFDGERYHLASYVVMPNHVHVLFAPMSGNELPALVHSWKRFTARQINLREGKSCALWQPDYWDRLIRGQEHFDWVSRYIAENPAKLFPGSYLLWP
jgi:REP element-mobilizing transposase RayT